MTGEAEKTVYEARKMIGEAEKTIREERKMTGEAEKTIGEVRKMVGEAEKTIGEVRKTFRSPRSQVLLPYCVPSVSAVSRSRVLSALVPNHLSASGGEHGNDVSNASGQTANVSGRIYNARCLTGYALQTNAGACCETV